MSQDQYYSRYEDFSNRFPCSDFSVSLERYHEWMIKNNFITKGES